MNQHPEILQRSGQTIAALVAGAAIVGLGTGTREAHETFLLVEHTTRALIERGFRVVALLDNQRVGELYDRYVRGEDVDLDATLAQAWGPWRTAEMRAALVWLRRFNEGRPDDPVRIVAVDSSRVLPADYDRVVELLTPLDATAAMRIRELLDVIRTAHDSGEHVQRARGTHPGTPFVELARHAQNLAAQLPDGAARDDALLLLDAMVEHHANAIGVGYDAAREERDAAGRLLEHQRRSGERIVLWEGSAHVAAHPGGMMGSHLRAALGDGYLAVHITIGRGRIRNLDLPDPDPASLEAVLLAGGEHRIVDLRARPPVDLADRLDRPWRTRLVSGVYDPARDAEHYYDLPSLTSSFDVVAAIPTVTPAQPLAAS